MLKLQHPNSLADLAGLASARLTERFQALGLSPAACPRVEIRGYPGTSIESLAAVDESGPGALTFANNQGFLRAAAERSAAAVIIPPSLVTEELSLPALVVDEPRLLFAVILDLMGSRLKPPPVAGQAIYADRASVTFGPEVVIGPGAYIGRGVKLGARTVISPQVYLEDGVEIGDDCLIHPRAVIRWGVKIGRRCQIHAGAVIGEDGFGYTQLPCPAEGRLLHYKNEHLGGVVIEDDVEVGANAGIDRGLVSDTVIGRGSKIDNLVQIGHNCRLGRDCIVVAQVGIGGHSRIGDRAFLLGQVGLGPGVSIGADAIITAQSGLGSGSVPEGRKAWSGTPLRLHEEDYRLMALSASQLPKVRKFFSALKKSRTFEEMKSSFLAPEAETKATEVAKEKK